MDATTNKFYHVTDEDYKEFAKKCSPFKGLIEIERGDILLSLEYDYKLFTHVETDGRNYYDVEEDGESFEVEDFNCTGNDEVYDTDFDEYRLCEELGIN